MKRAFLALALALAILTATPAAAQSVVMPNLPVEFLDTTYHTPTGTVRTVSAGQALQPVLDAAVGGDVIVLEAGATFTGNFILREKELAQDWIYVVSSDLGSLAERTRVSPADTSHMAHIVTPNTAPAIRTAGVANHWRLVGLDISASYTANLNNTVYNVVKFGDLSPVQTDADQAPHDIVVDRCIVQGNDQINTTQGVADYASRSAVIDSYIFKIHSRYNDAQAILVGNAPGPYKFVNNYLEGSGENFMSGGFYTSQAEMLATDIEFRRNDVVKPLSWKETDPSYAGIDWVEKNLFEIKSAKRVLVEANNFENSWVDGQTGIAIALKAADQSSTGVNPWAACEDVWIRNNRVSNANEGVLFDAREHYFANGTHGTHIVNPMSRVLVENNLFENIYGQKLFYLTTVSIYVDPEGVAHRELPVDVTIRHNTITGPATSNGNLVLFAGGNSTVGYYPAVRFRFTDNIVGYGGYGITGNAVGTGVNALNTYAPGAVFTGNVIVKATNWPANSFPAGNTRVANYDPAVGFTNMASGDYRLAAGGPFCGTATDGTDPGVNWDTFNAAHVVNEPPVVYAGEDFTVRLPDTAMLSGTISDDGNPSGTTLTLWVQVSGPATAVIANPQSLTTTVTFPVDGEYTFRLGGTDGEFVAVDDVVGVVVEPSYETLVERLAACGN